MTLNVKVGCRLQVQPFKSILIIIHKVHICQHLLQFLYLTQMGAVELFSWDS